MKILWNYIDSKAMPYIAKQKRFLFLNVLVSLSIALIVSLIVGVFHGLDGAWLEGTIIVAGYSAFGFGFLGGWLYLCNISR